MELSTLACGRPSPLLLGHFSPRSISISSPFAPLHPKSIPGLGLRDGRLLRAKASDETTVVVVDDASRKRVEGHSFLMQSSSSDEEASPSEHLLSDLSLKVDPEDASTTLFFGAGALVSLWVSAAIVSSLDSLPVFPKVMEVAGLGFTIWFTSRYLIFKENRDEFFQKLDDLKEKVLGLPITTNTRARIRVDGKS